MVPLAAKILTLKRLKVKVKGTAWFQWKGLPQGSCMPNISVLILGINTSEDMSQVKVFVTEGQTDRGTEG